MSNYDMQWAFVAEKHQPSSEGVQCLISEGCQRTMDCQDTERSSIKTCGVSLSFRAVGDYL